MASNDSRPPVSADPLADEAVYRAALSACANWLKAGDAARAVEALQDTMSRLEREAQRGPLRARQVLVVGGAGYVGAVMVRELLKQGYGVRVLDNFLYANSLSMEGLFDEPGFSFVFGDMRDQAVLDRALDGVTDVVLLASLVGDPISKKYPELTRSVNGGGSEALFEAMKGRGIHKFVFTSTCSNYGMRTSDDPATEEAELKPLSIYAETKVAFEKYILTHADKADFIPTILRISTAFGLSPRMRFDLTVNEFTAALARGEALDVYDKDTWRPYCHVRDIAGAVIRVLEADETKVRGEVFNVGSDENNYTKAMIIEEILKHIDGKVNFVEHGSDPRNYRVSFRKIREVLDFVPQHSVAGFVPELIGAVHAGFYQRQNAIQGYYGNYEVRPEVAAA
jgi:nucleoside-diphosphate-sugar epimerase